MLLKCCLNWSISSISKRLIHFGKHQEVFLDFRSDTVTKPSLEMRRLMYEAVVGDDVYKEDESVNELERVTAELFGMQKSLFVPSGTMGNLLCIMAHCDRRGQELIIGDKQHVYVYEQGHFMQLASVSARVLPNQQDGTIRLNDIKENIKTNDDFHSCETSLICLENTHMSCGGIPLPNDYIQEVVTIGEQCGIPVHIDGARLFNAAVATGQPLRNLLVGVNSVSMCLSKGLGCPVGSMIGGSEEFIWRAMRIRKSLGGGMRQVGFLAAAGLHALEHGHIYIQKDHDNAKLLAEIINSHNMHDVIKADANVCTNIVFVHSKENKAFEVADKLNSCNVRVGAFNSSLIRLVTHRDVTEEDIFKFNDILGKVLQNF